MSTPRPLPKKKGDLEDAFCPVCKSKVTRPFGTESVCGPYGHTVPVTVFQTGVSISSLFMTPSIVGECPGAGCADPVHKWAAK